MNNSARFLINAPVFYGKQTPEKGYIAGYAAITAKLKLPIPIPSPIALICLQNKNYQTEEWNIYPKSYNPEGDQNLTEIEALYKHLVFSLKYEGVNLLFFSFLSQHLSDNELAKLVGFEQTGRYSRRIWFLIEWVSGIKIKGKQDLNKKSYIPVLNNKHQYTVSGEKSPRHLVINNLPGTPQFCPLIRKTKKLDNYINANFSEQKSNIIKGIHKDILQRASAFLLLRDSKASFTIEGESPKSKRAARWGQAIGQAGSKDLTAEEFIRLQQVVIENTRFVEMGFRKKGGFVGEHDRFSGEPLPDHISAKWQDIEQLIEGLIKTSEILLKSNIDPIIAATSIAFGFVFIHPFEDGNGRIHRYLIHHILAKSGFSKQGIIFPVSASILDHIDEYRNILESYSHPLLDFIEWKETKDHNIDIMNQTVDYYRYFDATKMAEFLYSCVQQTIDEIIPSEVDFLRKYDLFKQEIEEYYDMPDKMIALLVRFLGQGEGKLSKRARDKEFNMLTDEELTHIENVYSEIFI